MDSCDTFLGNIQQKYNKRDEILLSANRVIFVNTRDSEKATVLTGNSAFAAQ